MTALKTVVELKSAAKSLGIKGFSKMNKPELIKAIDDFYKDARKENVVKGMGNAKRHMVYTRTNGTSRMTPAQSRRIKKNARKRDDALTQF